MLPPSSQLLFRVRLVGLLSMLVLGPIALAGTLAAPASPDGLPNRAQPMRVAIVRDTTPGCAPTCAEWIAAQGKIEPGTRVAFDHALRAIGSRRLPIFIDSLGGSVNDAIAIGRHIRAHHLDVVVTRTAFDACAAGPTPCPAPPRDGPTPGRPHGIGAVCASACVLILAAGTKREAAPWTVIGVHQMIVHQTMTRMQRMFRVVTRTIGGEKVEISRTLVSERPVASLHFDAEPSRGLYDNVGTYLTQMGIGAAMMPLMRATPGNLDPPAHPRRGGGDRHRHRSCRWRVCRRRRPPGRHAAAIPTRTSLLCRRHRRSGETQGQHRTRRLVARTLALGSDVGRPCHPSRRRRPSRRRAWFVLRIAPSRQSDVPPVLDVTFTTTPTNVEIRTIQRIGAPQTRSLGTTGVYTLPASVRSVGDKAFQIHLTGGSARWVVDQGMINDRPWIDIPMMINGGPRSQR